MTDAPQEPTKPEAAPVFTLVRAMAGLTAIIGVVMIVLALVGGGGLGSYGVLVGAFFLAAGVARLRLLHVRSKVQR